MALFQVANPWKTNNYLLADLFIWISVIICALLAFFLLWEYFKTHKTYHLVWSIAFIAATIIFHQITFVGSFSVVNDSLGAAFALFIPGGLAAGLLYSVFENKKIAGNLSYGTVYLIFILVGSTLIAFLIIYSDDLNYSGYFYIVMVISNSVSSALIIGLPLYTRLKTKETSKVAYFMMAYGFLAGAGGISMSVAATGTGDAFIAIGLYSYFLVISKSSIAFSLLFEKKWAFSIPGIKPKIKYQNPIHLKKVSQRE